MKEDKDEAQWEWMGKCTALPKFWLAHDDDGPQAKRREEEIETLPGKPHPSICRTKTKQKRVQKRQTTTSKTSLLRHLILCTLLYYQPYACLRPVHCSNPPFLPLRERRLLHLFLALAWAHFPLLLLLPLLSRHPAVRILDKRLPSNCQRRRGGMNWGGPRSDARAGRLLWFWFGDGGQGGDGNPKGGVSIICLHS